MTKIYFPSAVKFLTLAFFFLISGTTVHAQIPTEAANISAGKALFEGNCKTCHEINKKKVGPPLAGIYDRAPSIDWIKAFVKNSSAVIASGDAYAKKIYEENGKTQMTAFTSFKDEQILDILAYIKKETEDPTSATSVAVKVDPTPGGDQPVSSTYLNVILVGMLVILILLVIILSFLVSSLKRFLDSKNLSEEDKEVVHSPITGGSMVKSSAFIFIVAFLVAGLGFKAVINGLYSIGIQQGYAPKQPIAFSHKIHAGQYEIDCKYCHVGVMKGKSATIPSLNICMNCHNQIKTGTTTGEAQIAEILSHYSANEPIEWVRIHNLPDLAYFNHAQHVNVAGVECETCHGPVKEMDVVRQHSLLTMGWCIDCHRKTDLRTDGNAYYDKLVELHNEARKNGSAKNPQLRVEDNGGLECAKCHY